MVQKVCVSWSCVDDLGTEVECPFLAGLCLSAIGDTRPTADLAGCRKQRFNTGVERPGNSQKSRFRQAPLSVTTTLAAAVCP